ncbi:YiiX/YebB-like N1pC/P60 family cysteine hydrolase [Xanthomonas bundabergensis]|uniref:YiiX/YebB-like N1pC/P60 family cysteine hydrolase n=1 Tax=Xanthomonas bundabergensis TaxID=3160842 RepID=UPI003517B8A3
MKRIFLASLLHPLLRPLDWAYRVTDRRYEGLWLGGPAQLLRVSDVREGDILFGVGEARQRTSCADVIAHRVISHFSSGPYVHVGIALAYSAGRRPRIYEAVAKPGVQKVDIAAFVERYAYVSVYRLSAWQTADLKQVRRYALARLGQRYRFAGAGASALRQWRLLIDEWRRTRNGDFAIPARAACRARLAVGAFCSSFVIDVLANAAIPGLDDALWQSNAYTPNGLAEAAQLLEFEGFIASSLDVIDADDPAVRGAVGWR